MHGPLHVMSQDASFCLGRFSLEFLMISKYCISNIAVMFLVKLLLCFWLGSLSCFPQEM